MNQVGFSQLHYSKERLNHLLDQQFLTTEQGYTTQNLPSTIDSGDSEQATRL
jgi:hypothetical protein